MLVLFETSAGYAIFKVLKENKLEKVDDLYKYFTTPEAASKFMKMKYFVKFKDLAESVSATSKLIEGKLGKKLKRLLKVISTENEQLAVGDQRLGALIKSKVAVDCVWGAPVVELLRCIRTQLPSLMELPVKQLSSTALGLTHGLCRYKLKFSADKIDIMIVHAIAMLDDLDKVLNNLVMRAREWYGWHFPEMSKLVTDPLLYSQLIFHCGDRTGLEEADLSRWLSDEDEVLLKASINTSIGMECAPDDISKIKELCSQAIQLIEYRTHLTDYLSNRMMVVAPNVTVLVGELVGARLISHAGSLLKLAKQPSSTVQIFGAEKTLFLALKNNRNTPKYGLIYSSQLVGQTSAKLKGKASRMLAAKVSLASRVDALCDEDVHSSLGIEHRASLEARLKLLEENATQRISGTGRANAQMTKRQPQRNFTTYRQEGDSTMPQVTKRKKSLTDSKPKRARQE